jgi:hypothetical protein
MADDEVPGQTNADQRDIGAASDFDVDDRQEDRKAASSREHDVEHRVVGIVISLTVAREPMLTAEQLTAGDRQFLRAPVRRAGGAREILAENVEHRDGAAGINDSKFGGHGKRQDVHPWFRLLPRMEMRSDRRARWLAVVGVACVSW